MPVPHVHRQLLHRPEPRPRKLAGEPVVAEEHVRHALAFRSRQPGRHHRVHDAHVRLDHQRPAGDHHHDALDAAAHLLDQARPRLRNREVQVVAKGLGVRLLADHYDGVGEVVALDESGVGVLGEDDLGGRVDGGFDGLEDGGSCRKQCKV